MDTNDNSFVKILKEYFSQKPQEDLERENNGDIILETDWFYGVTQHTQINGKKFEEYLAGALCVLRNTIEKNGRLYLGYYDGILQKAEYEEEKNKKRTLTPSERGRILQPLREKIFSKIGKIAFRLFDKDGNILDNAKFIITGIDGYTTQEICEKPEGKFYQSSEEELYMAILTALSMPLELNSDLKNFALPTIRENMIDLANNFVKYYEYLLDEKNKSQEEDVIEITLKQDTAIGPKRVDVLGTQFERKNDLIDFNERKQILKKAGLKQVAQIVSADMGSEIKSNNYTMFTKQVKGIPGIEDGLLVWLEPEDGEHYSRIAFCTQERIEKIREATGKEDMIQALATYFYCKSHSDFIKETNISSLAHTSKETFERMVDVLASQNEKTNQGLYKKDTNEYHRQRKRDKLFGIGEFKKLVETVAQEEFEKAEGALSAMLAPEIGLDEKNKGGE